MSVEVPAEPAYYYEASRGEFRLLYFIPVNSVPQLFADPDTLLRDYPDGVDITCTRADFEEFRELYGFHAPHDPAELREAFRAIWTSTRDWQIGTHSGFLPVQAIEGQLPQISGLAKTILEKDGFLPPTGDAPIQERREFQKMHEASQQQLEASILDYHPEQVNRDLSIESQDLGEIKMKKGIPAADLFIRLSQQKR